MANGTIQVIAPAIIDSVTVATGWTSSYDTYLKKCGQIVELYLEVSGGTYSSGWNTLAVLPVGFRPSTYFDAGILDNINSNFAQGKITSSGLVQIYNSGSVSNNLRMHVVFIAA